jgi:hypothetical protein
MSNTENEKKYFINNLLFVSGIILGVFLFSFLLVGAVGFLRSDGKIKYCYITCTTGAYVPVWYVYGFREWRTDRLISVHTSFEDANEAFKDLDCKTFDEEK